MMAPGSTRETIFDPRCAAPVVFLTPRRPAVYMQPVRIHPLNPTVARVVFREGSFRSVDLFPWVHHKVTFSNNFRFDTRVY